MKGFLLSFLFNLIFHAEWLVLAIIALLLHIFLGFPMVIVYILSGLWILLSLLITLGLGILSKDIPSSPFQKNVNPYSKTTKDYTEKLQNNNIDSKP